MVGRYKQKTNLIWILYCASFTKCIRNIDRRTTDDIKNLDLVISMSIFIEYNSNDSETVGGLWLYSKHEATAFDNDIKNNFKSFKHKAKLLENTEADVVRIVLRNATIAVLLTIFRKGEVGRGGGG